MSKYVLLNRGYGESRSALESRIGQDTDLVVVDKIGDNLVVEGRREAVQRLMKNVRGWSSTPERKVRQPRVYAAH